MSLVFAGIGVASPEHFIAQSDAAERAPRYCAATEDRRRLAPALFRRSGVKKRHSVVLEGSTGEEPARQTFFSPAESLDDRGPTTAERMRLFESATPQLATQAARRALQDAGARSAEITHLVTVTCSGFAAPGFDISLMHELPLPPQTARTHVGFMGCHGALNGLRVARAFLEADPGASVLLCAVELCSLHYQYGWDPQKVVANAIFADGAAAVVARVGGKGSWQLIASGCALLPETSDMMSWRIGDHGFEMTLSPRVPETIRERVGSWLASWLAQHGLNVSDVASWAIHPGGPRILQACGEGLGIDAELLEPSLSVFAEYGNMSSPTLLFILERLRQQNAPRPCVMLGFGPGLTVEAALLQ